MHQLKFFIFIYSLFFIISATAQQKYIINRQGVSAKIEEFVSSSKIFNMTNTDFEKKWMNKFALSWTDKFKRSARGTQPISFNEMSSKETTFKFRKKTFTGATLMLYNQGDEGALTKTRFYELIKKSTATIDKMTKVKGGFKPGNKVTNRNIHFWVKMPYLYKLEYSFSMVKPSKFGRVRKSGKRVFKAEYIRLVISKGSPKINTVTIDKVDRTNLLSAMELKSMVTKDDKGGVYIEGIPMVDQGQKGYCACATTARILNYYGRDIDQHDIAKIAVSSGDMGTDPEKLKKAIYKISSKLSLNMKTVAKCYISSDREYSRLWKLIERECKKKDIPIQKTRYRVSIKKTDLSRVFKGMSEKNRRYKAFIKAVKQSIDRGRPLAWALRLGIITEPDIPQASGGHMRLIIGYNEKENEIYYSDTWGKGHELKKMKAYNAFFTSMAIWEISPR